MEALLRLNRAKRNDQADEHTNNGALTAIPRLDAGPPDNECFKGNDRQ